MRVFVCPVCRSLLSFEDPLCLACGTSLGYDRPTRALVDIGVRTPCVNRAVIGCNWLSAGGRCDCCALTRVRPRDADVAGMSAWARTETAKRRLVYQLDELGLPTAGVSFELLSSDDQKVITGHADGVITIDMAEGDDVHREQLRIGLGESYRTMLGHLRHEIGHWYWQVLVDSTDRQPAFRTLFGDERLDYALALKQHYAATDDRSWTATYVSRYAASHPWEDWAECFAHYLHIRDTLQTTAAWQLRIGGPRTDPPVAGAAALAARPVEGHTGFDELVASWLPITFALNAVSRSLGQADAYPFVLPPPVLAKLQFVHDVVAK